MCPASNGPCQIAGCVEGGEATAANNAVAAAQAKVAAAKAALSAAQVAYVQALQAAAIAEQAFYDIFDLPDGNDEAAIQEALDIWMAADAAAAQAGQNKVAANNALSIANAELSTAQTALLIASLGGEGVHTCTLTPANDGTGCSDNNSCTAGDACAGGTCASGAAVNCDDANVCTDDACNPATGCATTNNTASCSDGKACTQGDSCLAGACSGANPIECTASDQCHVAGACDPTNGTCNNPAKTNGSGCSDNNLCTTIDTCQAGSCVGTTAPNCDDNNVCTNDSCAATSGCVHLAVANGVSHVASKDLIASELQSGTESNPNGVWTYGFAPAGNVNSNFVPMQASHHTNAWYGVPGIEGWVNNLSAEVPMVVVNTTSVAKAMPYGITVPAGRMLIHPGQTGGPAHYVVVRYTAPASGSFNFGITTQKLHFGVARSYVFHNGNLVPGTTVTASDAGNSFTLSIALATGDRLDFATDAPSGYGGTSTGFEASVIVPSSPCNDGNACTQTDTCTNGACTGANPVVCSASDQCHVVGLCDSANGTCSNPNKGDGAGCTDGSACTNGDTCQGGACNAGAAVDCNDGLPCSIDSCNPASGCVHVNKPDTDSDGVCDDTDNCPTVSNCAVPPGQTPSTPFKAGENEVIVEVQNLNGGDQGCFGLRMDVDVDGQTQTVGSNGSWKMSTTVTSGTTACGQNTLQPAGSAPSAGTFTAAPSGGSSVCGNFANAWGVQSIGSGSSIRFYRTTFNLPSFTTVTAKVRLGIDNAGVVRVNGKVLAVEDDCDGANWDAGNPPRVDIAANGTITIVAKFDGPSAPTTDCQTDTDQDGIGDACECLGVTCSAQDECHVAGKCQSTTGACTNPNQVDSTPCGTDLCSDSGDATGGGSCQAVKNTCQSGSCTASVTSGSDTCLGTAAAPALKTFFCKGGNTCASGITAKGADSCSDSGDDSGGGSCNATDWQCSGGKISSASSSGTDTCGGDAANPSVTTYSCQNNNACVAGSQSGSDSCNDSGDQLGGGECGAIDFACTDGVLGSTKTSGTDTCGGSDANPSVTTYACAGGNQCVAGSNSGDDSCTDTGNGFGGGSCAASNWQCADGTLGVSTSSGSDTCTGTADAPGVTTYACSNNDTCVEGGQAQQDGCSDSGTASGGGVCGANDWACAGGVLSSVATSGDDTCGDGSSSQKTYFVCSTTDGTVADKCVVVPDVTAPDLTVPGAKLVDLDTPQGTQVTLLASAGDVCDSAVGYIWYEGTTVLSNSAGLTHLFTLGVHELTVVATDDSGNAAAGFVKVTVRDTCGNGSLTLHKPSANVPACPKPQTKTKVKTLSELAAWQANPTTSLEIADPLAFGGQSVVIATNCDVKVQSKAKLTGIKDLFIAGREVDIFADVVMTGRADLRASGQLAVRQKSTWTGVQTIAMEGTTVDEWGDTHFATGYCIEAVGHATVRQASRNGSTGGYVKVIGGTVDLFGDFTNPGKVDVTSAGRLEYRTASKITGAGAVTMTAGGELDFHGDLGTAQGVTLNAATAILRTSGSILSAGNVTVKVGGNFDGHGKVRFNGAVKFTAGTYRLFQSHDFTGNAACTISGTADKNSKPANGCTAS